MAWTDTTDSTTDWTALTELAYLLTEDGYRLFQEDGSAYILLEESISDIWTPVSDAVTTWTN